MYDHNGSRGSYWVSYKEFLGYPVVAGRYILYVVRGQQLMLMFPRKTPGSKSP